MRVDRVGYLGWLRTPVRARSGGAPFWILEANAEMELDLGEIVGGLYEHNYASGTGLMAGAVFGRLAGGNAAAG